MAFYLGDILIKNYFVNFRPLYKYENGEFEYLNSSEKDRLLPESQYPWINLYSNRKNEVNERFFDGDYILFDFETQELEGNFFEGGVRNPVGYKLNISEVKPEKIKSLEDINYYYYINAENIKGNYRTHKVVYIHDDYVYDGMKIVISDTEDNNKVLGPFTVKTYDSDEQYIVVPISSEQNYTLKMYKYPDSYKNHLINFGTYDKRREYIKIDEKYSLIDDVITDEILLESFNNIIDDKFFEECCNDKTKLTEFLKQNKNSVLFGSNISDEIRNNRIDKITDLLTGDDLLVIREKINFISDIIGQLLVKNQNNDDYKKLLEDLFKDPDFINRIQKIKIISDKIQSKENELEELNRDIAFKNQELQELEERPSREVANERIQQYNDDIDSLSTKKEDLKIEVNKLNLEIDELTKRLNLVNNIEILNNQVIHKSETKKELENSIEDLESKISAILKSKGSKMVDLAFDGMLSSKMLQKAAEWEQDNNSEQLLAGVNKVNSLSISSLQGEELINYLVERIHEYRQTYDKNLIINILICISQGFLTVFSGEPGTGKTSICKILSRVLGLMLPADLLSENDCSFNPNRFVTVAVERGWTSKRDFIGYYNPLTKRFDNNNRQLFDSFKILDLESRNNQNILPYMILLDEANLSPMEYYWADFMSLCDDFDESAILNLGDDNCYKIPASLRFLATINNDHTTEALSPRLIDRAWVIELPKVKGNLSFKKYTNDGVKLITWNSIVNTFNNLDTHVSMTGTVKDTYDKIVEKLKEIGVFVSPRVDIAIQKYWSVAQSLFENDITYGTDSSIVALDYAISQRLLPHIDVNGKKIGESLEEIFNICKTQNLKQSAGILKRIIDEGERTMNYYQFFA